MGGYNLGKPHPSGVKAGAEANNWKGGRRIDDRGYVHIWTGPHTTKLEHHILAEKALGHALPPGAVVHHVNENPSNNGPGNLVICQDDTYHKLLHARKRRLEDTGSFALKRCGRCGVVHPLESFSVDAAEWDGRRQRCKSCRVAEVNECRQRRRERRLAAFII
jgi:hypothetical protein